MSVRRLAVALVVVWATTAGVAAAQEPTRLVIRDPGPGRLGSIVRSALTRPYTVDVGDTTDLVLPRDTVLPRSLFVIGRDVRIEGRVDGDLIVLNGDLYLRPGARVAGDVIATGGAVYDSYLVDVRGQRLSFRDETMVARPLPGGDYELTYLSRRHRAVPTFTLPGIYGLRVPTYDRVNGLTVPGGPRFHLLDGAMTIDPIVNYRSNLGKVDPYAVATMALTDPLRVEIEGGRTSRTNDAWITSDFSNSLNSIWSGRDTRNWYRADLLQARLHRRYEMESGEVTPYLGGQWERAWTTGIQDAPEHLPWSVTDRTDSVEGMARPNPPVREGHIASAVAGVDGLWDWRPRNLQLRTWALLEGAPSVVGDDPFTQLTLDGRVTFPLSRARQIMFRFEWHGVGSIGDPPPQRFAYLGGSGTIKTLDLLSEGGDQLLYFESRAWMPVDRWRIRYVGSPVVMVRHMMGAAGVDHLPGFTHNLALRIALGMVRAEIAVDPIHGDTDFSFGVAFTR